MNAANHAFRLSQCYAADVATAYGIEHDFPANAQAIIDAGFFLEAYGNPDGVEQDDATDGGSLFFHVDVDTDCDRILKVCAHLGSLRDGTLTLRVVGADETQERGFCAETAASALCRDAIAA